MRGGLALMERLVGGLNTKATGAFPVDGDGGERQQGHQTLLSVTHEYRLR